MLGSAAGQVPGSRAPSEAGEADCVKHVAGTLAEPPCIDVRADLVPTSGTQTPPARSRTATAGPKNACLQVFFEWSQAGSNR